ncbi:MAG: transcription elongation GreA/GreB family factor [Rhodothermales bacterium]|jgi:transcription elongation GreA/GreB family factor
MDDKKLESVLLEVAEGNEQAIASLNAALASSGISESGAKVIKDNYSLFATDASAFAKKPSLRELALHLAHAGVDDMLLRDALAAIVRAKFSDYTDPAGLIRALCVLDKDTDVRVVRRRIQSFESLRENAIVWHNSYGIGRVAEIDDFSDTVYLKFSSRQTLSLQNALSSLFIAKPGSIVEETMERNEFKPKGNAAAFDAEVATSFVPTLGSPLPVTASILVPRLMNKKGYDEWRREGSVLAASTANAKRTWDQARGLEELKNGLIEADSIVVKDENVEHLRTIFKMQSTKPPMRYFFAECLARLWSLCPAADWLVQLIKDLPEDVVAWKDPDTFQEVTSTHTAKLVVGWLHAARINRGREWFVETVTRLPLRYYNGVEEVLDSDPDCDNLDDLYASIVGGMRKSVIMCDALVWLWRQGVERETVFGNPRGIFQIMNKKVKGEFLKAKRDLMKLLLDNQDFQRCVLQQGDEAAITSFVSIVKHHPVLSKGEQQSILVKICRIYPHAEEIVAERKKVVARRAIPKMTSMRRIEEAQVELKAIIDVKIPANVRAISAARDLGDLRENAEFKAAKEEQKLLRARRYDLEKNLHEITATDFGEVKVEDMVIPGCTVSLTYENGTEKDFHVVGLWDSVPELQQISYDTPLGRILINRKVGDSVETPLGMAMITALAPLPKSVTDWIHGNDA